MNRWMVAALLVALMGAAPHAARACGGFGEAPDICGEGADTEAKYLLQRAVNAVDADKAKALGEFTHGEDGFRTVDSYVFCVGPTGIMTAHPNPVLQGQDVRELHDQTGNYFIATMMKTAKPGEVSQISYLFPRPGGTVALPKTTFYTRAGDQVCAVGVYEDADSTTAAATLTPAARLAQLRLRLTAEMPSTLGGDWTAFLQALDEQGSAQQAAFARVRDQVRAAEPVLAAAASPR